jgi:ABC-2 type transport system ATP-binding protein
MNVLEVAQLHARYGKREVLRNVSLEVLRGRWLCLLGPNGVGKSTLLHCVSGQLAPASGTIRIAGEPLATAAAKRALGYACAPEQLPGLLTGRQCLEIYAYAKDLDAIDDDVAALAAELAFTPYFDAFVDTYSLGTRQKLCVLLALLGNPQLIVLDEAFNGLDPRSSLIVKRELRGRLAAQRCGVLLATHSLDIVERYADAAALLLDGTIAQRWDRDSLEQLRALGLDALEQALAAAADASPTIAA